MTDPADRTRSIELEVEVPGTPEEVWDAVATGPGITSWFIPMEVEERAGGSVTMDFGTMGTTTGEVDVWEPPHRVVFRSADQGGLAFEWLVEARDGGSCVVRLVNSGFGEGDEWDEQFHGMSDGWRIFMENLRLQRTHFPGRHARAIIPTVTLPGPGAAGWTTFCDALGISPDASVGDRIATAGGAPPLAGRVESVATSGARAYHLLLDQPCPGTAFVAIEGDGEQVAGSVYLYLHDSDLQGDGHRPVDDSLKDEWFRWLGERFPAEEAAVIE